MQEIYNPGATDTGSYGFMLGLKDRAGSTFLDRWGVKTMFAASKVSEINDTIGGFVFGLVGTNPKRGDKVKSNDYTLVVEKHDKQRVRSVRVITPDL